MVRRSSSPPPDSAPVPQDGQIDPKRLDVAARRKRRAKGRKEPSAELRQWEQAAERRACNRPLPPGVMLAPAGMDEEHWTSPHNDSGLWTLQLADALGTRSLAVISTFMGQLESLCKRSFWDESARQWRLDENQFSAALAMVNSIRPKNEMEAALAAQMVAVHFMQMKTAAKALQYDYDPKLSAVSSKLARTFAMQVETLRGLKGGKKATRQTITVRKELHQHVHYHDARGGGDSSAQPREPRTIAIDHCATLRGEEPGGKVVPLPSRKGP